MKKMILRMFFVFVVLISAFVFLPNYAYATLRTQAEAVAWARSQIRQPLHGDGECVRVVQSYYVFLGVPIPRGAARSYGTPGDEFGGLREQNTVPAGWTTIRHYQGFVAQPGDVAVWTYYWSVWGHVGIVISADSNQMTYVDQARNRPYVMETTRSYIAPNTVFWGVIRPNFSYSQPSLPAQPQTPQAPLSVTDLNSNRVDGTRQDTFVFTVRTNVPSQRVELNFSGVNGHGRGAVAMNRSSDGMTWTLSINRIFTGTQTLTATAFGSGGVRAESSLISITVSDSTAPPPIPTPTPSLQHTRTASLSSNYRTGRTSETVFQFTTNTNFNATRVVLEFSGVNGADAGVMNMNRGNNPMIWTLNTRLTVKGPQTLTAHAYDGNIRVSSDSLLVVSDFGFLPPTHAPTPQPQPTPTPAPQPQPTPVPPSITSFISNRTTGTTQDRFDFTAATNIDAQRVELHFSGVGVNAHGRGSLEMNSYNGGRTWTRGLTGVFAGTQTLTVIAHMADGTRAYSSPMTIIVADETPAPETPSITSFISNRTTGTTQDRFDFTATTNIDAQRVELHFSGVGANAHGRGSLEMNSYNGGRTWTWGLTGVFAGTQTLTVIAHMADGTRVYSSPMTIIVADETPVPATPSITSFTSNRTTGTTQDRFDFTATTNIDAQRVELHFSGVGANAHGRGSLEMNSHNGGRTWTRGLTGVFAGTQMLTVIAHMADGTRVYSSPMTITVF